METYFELLRKLWFNGREINARGHKTAELICESLVIPDPRRCLYSIDGHRPFDKMLHYLKGEFAWYMTGNLNPDAIIPYSKFWDKLRNQDGTVNSNYGNIVFYAKQEKRTQYEWCLDALTDDMFSRQAIIIYSGQKYMYKENKDFVCTQTQQFMIRNNKLISIVYIRSSDVIRGLSFDTPWWSLVQQSLLLDLKPIYPDLELGELVINFGSVHIYEEHFDLVFQMIHSTRDKIDLYNVVLDRTSLNWILGLDFDRYLDLFEQEISVIKEAK